MAVDQSLAQDSENTFKLSSPHFSSPRGIYESRFNLVISTANPEGAIIYTLDGTAPSLANGIRTEEGKPVVILVESNTIVKAIMTKGEDRVGKVVTHTYLFPKEILNQTQSKKRPHNLDVEMDPEVTKVDVVADQIQQSFYTIPSVSLTMDQDSLFGDQGIYTNPEKSGNSWEKQCSFEWIVPGTRGQQENCGVQIQGASSRKVSRKHGLRLSFKSKFGGKKFRGKIFSKSKVRKFDSLVLRNPTHDSWAVGNPQWRREARYVNDMWAAETQRLMGHASPHHQWVHLFLNGFYWGIYDLCERPDEHFASAHFGGDDESYDVFNTNRLRSGDRKRRDLLTQLISRDHIKEPDIYEEVQRLLDVEAFCDYVIYNLYANNIDWITDNYWCIGSRKGDAQLRFINWDAEILFWESWSGLRNRKKQSALDYNILQDELLSSDTAEIGFFLKRLSLNPEFRRSFGDRAHHHLKKGGILSPEKVAARYRQLLNEVENLLDAESARWGDAYESEPMSMDSLGWEYLAGEGGWLFSNFFPKRTERFLEQLKKSQLYPQLDAPVLEYRAVKGGMYEVSVTSPNSLGKILISFVGQDPIGGENYLELEHHHIKPIIVAKGTQILARATLNGQWSALESQTIPSKANE